jgi:putative AdoMet-dependent methyltransferase
MEDRRALFDEWAEHYDASVDDESGFPFTGYRDVLATTLSAADPAPGQSVLDVGCGTGNLSLLFALASCDVTGVDFSPAMLDLARQRVPDARFLKLDLLGSWETLAGRQFDVIASAYVLHEFTLENKLAIIARLVEEHLKPGGRLVVADISFPTHADMAAAQSDLEEIWDEGEFYWSAEEAIAAMHQRGLSVAHTPVPPFAGVYLITPASA